MADEELQPKVKPEEMVSDEERSAQTEANTSQQEKASEEIETQIASELERLSKLYKDAPDFSELVMGHEMRHAQEEGEDFQHYVDRMEEWHGSREERIRKTLGDIEAICRHAFMINADNIIMMDKSARPYGIFTNRLLPIIRLEYCRKFNVPVEKVKLPKILFLNPRNHNLFIKRNFERQIFGKTNLVFDESTNALSRIWYEMTPADQYALYKIPGSSDELWERYRLKERSGTAPGDSSASVIDYVLSLSKGFPNSTFESHIGSSGSRGGVLREFFGIDAYVQDIENHPKNLVQPIKERRGKIKEIYEMARAAGKMELEKIGRELGLIDEGE